MISLGNYAKDTLEINMHQKLQLSLNDPLSTLECLEL